MVVEGCAVSVVVGSDVMFGMVLGSACPCSVDVALWVVSFDVFWSAPVCIIRVRPVWSDGTDLKDWSLLSSVVSDGAVVAVDVRAEAFDGGDGMVPVVPVCSPEVVSTSVSCCGGWSDLLRGTASCASVVSGIDSLSVSECVGESLFGCVGALCSKSLCEVLSCLVSKTEEVRSMSSVLVECEWASVVGTIVADSGVVLGGRLR